VAYFSLPLLSFVSPLLSLIFPLTCLICGREGNLLCPRCLFALPQSRPTCLGCGTESPLGQTCAECQTRLDVDGLVTLAPFADRRVQRLVKTLKYDNVRAHVLPWLEARHDLFFQFHEEQVIVPIPLHKKREQHRGYNQSMVIARALAHTTGWPVVPSLERWRFTQDQTTLSKAEREKNMADAFRVQPDLVWTVKGQHLLLVDDVATTGSTLAAAARELRSAGAVSIWAFTLARADQKEKP
jgi:competence protein ComFC